MYSVTFLCTSPIDISQPDPHSTGWVDCNYKGKVSCSRKQQPQKCPGWESNLELLAYQTHTLTTWLCWFRYTYTTQTRTHMLIRTHTHTLHESTCMHRHTHTTHNTVHTQTYTYMIMLRSTSPLEGLFKIMQSLLSSTCEKGETHSIRICQQL